MADGAQLAQAAQGKTLGAGAANCPYCDRVGLPILPLRYAYVPANVAQKWTAAEKPLKGGKYVLRVMQGGFVYMYDERNGGTWRCFAVTMDGRFREYPVDQRPTGKVTFSCSRSPDDTFRASFINVIKPKEAKRIWLAYSSVWWTKAVRNKYKANASMRGQRMQMLDIPTVLAGTVDHGFKIDPAGTALAQRVPEFGGGHAEFNLDAVSDNHRIPCLTPGLNRQADAGNIGRIMQAIMPGKGVAVGLDDVVGFTQQVRAYANLANGQAAQIDAKYARQITSKRAIDQLKKSFAKDGKQADWAKDYENHLKPGAIDQFEKTYSKERARPVVDRVNRCADFQTIVQAAIFKLVRDEDFDPDDLPASIAFVHQMADIVDGIGLDEGERKWALAIMSNADDNNLWLRIMTANQKTFLHHLSQVPDNLNDMGKNSFIVYDEWAKSNSKFAAALHHLTGAGTAAPAAAAAAGEEVEDALFRALTPATEAMGKALDKTLLNAQSLMVDVKVSSLKSLRAFTLAAALWSNTKLVPLVQEMEMGTALRYAKEARWRVALEARMQKLAHEPAGTKAWQMDLGDITDELGPDAHVKVRFVVVDWSAQSAGKSISDVTIELEKRQVIVPNPAGASNVGPKLAQVSHANPKTNFFRQGMDTARNGAANGVFCAIVIGFQIVAYGEAMEALHEAKTTQEKLVASFKLSAAIMGVTGGLIELTGSMRMLQVWSATGAVSVGATRLIGIGGAIGGAAGVIVGLVTMMDGWAEYKDGDTDAGSFKLVGGVALVASGLCGVLGGIATALEVTLLSLGPGGWAVLAVGALLIGLYLLFRSDEAKDDPFQTWLRRSCFGTHADYATAKLESEALGNLFRLQLGVSYVWHKGLAGYNVDVNIQAPALSERSYVDYELDIVQSDGHVLKAHESGPANSKLPGRQLVDPQKISQGEAPGLNPMGTAQGGGYERSETGNVHWSTSFLKKGWFNDVTVTKISVKLRYWPDKANNPGLELPKNGGVVFESTPGDAEKND